MEQNNERLNELMKQFFPDWSIDGELGSGSNGVVYKIHRGKEKEYSALKWIEYDKDIPKLRELTERGASQEEVRDFLEHTCKLLENEINLMEKLKDNIHIVGVDEYHIAERENGCIDLLIREELLTPVTKTVPSMKVSDVVQLGQDLCQALSECETKRIVHCDIKTENIFVNDNGEYKLGDFGAAKVLHASRKVDTQRGTPLFMAPEVYKRQPYDHHADIYSLGLVLYELLNGMYPPFVPPENRAVTAEEENESIRIRMDGRDLQPPCMANQAMSDIILKAASYDVEERYDTAGEMLQDLLKVTIPEADDCLLQCPEGYLKEPADIDQMKTRNALPRSTRPMGVFPPETTGTENLPAEQDDDDELPATGNHSVQQARRQRLNPFIAMREKREQTKKKIIRAGCFALAAILIAGGVLLIILRSTRISDIRGEQQGISYHLAWNNGGNGPWTITVSADENILSTYETDQREAELFLVPGRVYDITIGDSKQTVTMVSPEHYSGPVKLNKVKLFRYTVSENTTFETARRKETESVTAGADIGTVGGPGYLLRGSVKLDPGQKAEIFYVIICGQKIAVQDILHLEPAEDEELTFFNIPLNDLLVKYGTEAETLSYLILIDDCIAAEGTI